MQIPNPTHHPPSNPNFLTLLFPFLLTHATVQPQPSLQPLTHSQSQLDNQILTSPLTFPSPSCFYNFSSLTLTISPSIFPVC
ncbi:hypothetical protein SLEP1_g18792 [Rubroshorea leprosula]|uniref:Uncharacterized protein n=1 Tax=Rubroshorea leprosula TaxID=152421 RepID=A0AAV5J6D4_9ROSI|nr:hypothetical protein SLEP1_g18792 [Rubroshorea leprosula]